MLFLALVGGACGSATAQDAVLRGFITDAASGRPLVNANVVLHDTTGLVQAAVTDANGFYQLAPVAPGVYTVRISFIGYATRRDTLRLEPGARTISAALTPITQELQGVTVESRRDSIENARAGLQRISPADIDRIPTPGPGSDLAGYLRSQPGVVTLGDRGGQLYVRGGTPSQNLVLVDGTPVYKPFHIIGFYSAFPSDLVSSADFYAGGFGAEYMGRISSVLDVNLRPGNMKQNEARAAISPFVASVRAEGPLGWRRTSLLLHYRQSLIERTGSALLDASTPYRFYDATATLHTQGDNSQCSFTGVRTYDRGRIDPDRPASFQWTNTSVGGDCLVFGASSSQTADISFGATHFSNTVTTPDGSKRSAGTWRYHTTFRFESPTSWGAFNWGGWARADQYHFDLEELHLGLRADDDFAVAMGGFVEATWTPTDALAIEPSLGAQGLLGEANLNIEPRLRLAWEPGGSGTTRFTAATGLYHQLAVGITDERDAGTTFIAWFPTPAVNRPLQALHVLGGWEQRLAPSLTAHLEGYYKDLNDIPVPTWTPANRFNTTLSLAEGTAYGADVRLTYQQGPLHLQAGYGWNWVEYRAARDDLGAWTGGDLIRYHPPHDQRHSISLVGQIDTGLFEASARWQLSSGLPYTQVYGFDTLLELRGLRDQPTRDVGTPRLFYRQPYTERLPAYHRLDLSAERSFTLSPRIGLTAEVGSINTYDRANIFYIDIFSLERVNQLPLLPYLALTVTLQ